MNGLEAIKKIKEFKDLQNIPILALTASAFEQTKFEVMSLSDGYLQKPVTRRQLLGVLLEYLKNKPLSIEIPKINTDSSKKKDV